MIDPVVSVPAPIVKLDSMLPPRPVAVQFAWPITSQLTAASVVPDERSTVAVNAFRLAPLRWLTVPTDHVPTGPLPLVPRSTSVGDVVPGANCRSESPRLGLIVTEPTFRTFVCPRKSCAPPASLSPLMSPRPSVPATIVLVVASVSDEVPVAPFWSLPPFNPTRNTPAGDVEERFAIPASETTARWPAVTVPPGPTSKLPGPVNTSAPPEPVTAMFVRTPLPVVMVASVCVVEPMSKIAALPPSDRVPVAASWFESPTRNVPPFTPVVPA